MKKTAFILLATIIPCCLVAQSSLGQYQENKKTEKSSSLSTQERAYLLKMLTYSYTRFQQAIEGLSTNQINFKENAKKWSVAECIEHLALAELRFPEILKEQQQKGISMKNSKKSKITDERIRQKMISRVWKAKSPEIFKPSNQFKNYEQALLTLKQQRESTIKYIEETQDDLRSYFWKHPLTGTIDLYQTLLLMSAHLERHTEQIENIKKAKNFPYE